MKRIVILLSSLLILFASCSAEIIGNLPKVEIKDNVESSVRVLSSTGQTIKIGFTPVAYAKKYAYQVTGGQLVETGFQYANDMYSFEITSGLLPQGTIEIYASADITANETANCVSIGSVDYALSLSESIPDAYVSARYETSVEIRINSSLPTDSVVYHVTVASANGDDFSKYVISENSPVILVDGLEAEKEYVAYVFQTLKGDDEYSKHKELSIPSYDSQTASTIHLEMSSSGFEASGIPLNESVSLYKIGDSDPLLTSIQNKDGKAIISFDELKSLETGEFYVTSNTQRSNIIKCTIPLIVKTIEKNYRSAFIYFDFADDVDFSKYKISVSGAPKAKIGFLNDTDILYISQLDSDTDYGLLEIILTRTEDSFVFSCEVEIITKGFAGTSYSWTGELKPMIGATTSTNFVVDVDSAPDGSSFPYYVFLSPEDDASGGRTDLRIMPLIDASEGLPNPESLTNPGPLQEQAYLINSKKWNSMGNVSVSSWHIVNPDTTPAEKDIVTTVTESTAIGQTVETSTTFAFLERILKDESGKYYMQPYIKFKNVGTGLAKLGLYKNAEPQYLQFDGDSVDNEYCWYLTPVESN